MSDNVMIAIVAASAVVISAVLVLGGAVFAYIANNKRLDKIDGTLGVIQGDLKQFSEQIFKIGAKVGID
jgi:hypothetical protein